MNLPNSPCRRIHCTATALCPVPLHHYRGVRLMWICLFQVALGHVRDCRARAPHFTRVALRSAGRRHSFRDSDLRDPQVPSLCRSGIVRFKDQSLHTRGLCFRVYDGVQKNTAEPEVRRPFHTLRRPKMRFSRFRESGDRHDFRAPIFVSRLPFFHHALFSLMPLEEPFFRLRPTSNVARVRRSHVLGSAVTDRLVLKLVAGSTIDPLVFFFPWCRPSEGVQPEPLLSRGFCFPTSTCA